MGTGRIARPLFSCLSLLCGAALLVSTAPVQAASSLPSLALHGGDARGLRQIKGFYITDQLAARIDHVPVAAFARKGRILGYKTEFLRAGAASLDVQNVVVQYRSQSGATWDAARAARNTRTKASRSHAHSYGTVSRGVGGIGTRRVAMSYWVTLKGRQFVVGEVHFVRGRYRATVEVIANRRYTRQSAAVGYAEALARLVDSRLRRAR